MEVFTRQTRLYLPFTVTSKEKPVMFYALTERTFTLQTLSTVVYEKTIVNTGGHYNTFDGVFVAPRSGTYLFSWTSCTNAANYAFTELMVENQEIATAGVYEHAGNHHCGSMSSLCKMNKEDHAWIRTTPYGATNYFYSHRNTPHSSFLGMLLSSD
ncbi:complement C1q tumor necrosis factor-related protein 2-like [Mytilus trossulus]|uniref:complement C1q tumor necrosis factor-related protein 2-like n=1 Tax=Mytilus trossulus TaxID=6551 RepID=UPI00300416D3